MGLFDFLSGKPTPAKIEKIMKRMLNEHHQPQVRQESMEELAGIGTPLAIEALTRRLAVNFKDTIVNEQERRWVADILVERFGEQAVEPLLAFIAKEQNLSLAVRTLARLVSQDRLVTALVAALGSYAPADHRTIQAKMQIVDALEEIDDPRVIGALLPHLMDHDDDVRIKVVGVLEHKVPRHPEQRDAVRTAFAGLLLDAEAAGRILRRAAEAAVTLDLDFAAERGALSASLPDGFTLNADGRLARY
jgi:HEAT repeat protein